MDSCPKGIPLGKFVAINHMKTSTLIFIVFFLSSLTGQLNQQPDLEVPAFLEPDSLFVQMIECKIYNIAESDSVLATEAKPAMIIKDSSRYPNPFSASIIRDFEVFEYADIEIRLYNMIGRPVAIIHDGFLKPGKYAIIFENGHVASGMYYIVYYRDDAIVDMGKMMLLN